MSSTSPGTSTRYLATLLERLRSGDRKAGLELFELMEAKLTLIARTFLTGEVRQEGHHTDVLVQEVRVRLCTYFTDDWQWKNGKVPTSVGQLCQLLGQICRRHVIDLLRARQTRLLREEPVPVDGLADSRSDAQRALELREFMHRLIDELAEEDRAIIHMHYYAGLQIQKIAEELGCNRDTVSVRLKAAHAQLGRLTRVRGLSGSDFL